MGQVQRRQFLITAGALLAAPLAADAQQGVKTARIGVVWETIPAASEPLFEPLRQALGKLGYVEGQSIIFEQRWAEGKRERVPGLMMELIRLKVDVLALPSNPLIAAGKQATLTNPVPIVMLFAADPVGAGFVKSLAHPGANITGLSATVSPNVVGKIAQLLTEAKPEVRRLAHLYDPTVSGVAPYVTALQEATQQLGRSLLNVEIRSPSDIGQAFETLSQQKIEAVVVFPSPLTVAHGRQIAENALKQRMGTGVSVSELIDSGYLLAHGPSFRDLTARAATYIDRILKGARPGDLPIEQPTMLRLVINLKVANALGFTIPSQLLLQADRVIE